MGQRRGEYSVLVGKLEERRPRGRTRRRWKIQGDSVARGPKLLSVKNYVIEILI